MRPEARGPTAPLAALMLPPPAAKLAPKQHDLRQPGITSRRSANRRRFVALAGRGHRLAHKSSEVFGTHPRPHRRRLRHSADCIAVKFRFEDLGAVPKGSTPAELAAFLKSEMEKWGPVMRDSRIKLDN